VCNVRKGVIRVQGPSVTVIGAGIAGASVAYHLAQGGARVTVLESCPAAAAGVTGRSFGWVSLGNVMPAENIDLFLLRKRAVREFNRLEREWRGGLRKSTRGALLWRSTEQATIALVDGHHAHGSAVSALSSARFSEMEPSVISPPCCAAFAADDFAIEPVALAKRLLDGVREAGGAVYFGAPVEHIVPGNGVEIAIHTPAWTIRSDFVVIANGAGVAKLASHVGALIDIELSPATLQCFRLMRPLSQHILSGPDFELRHSADGSLLATEWPPDEGENGLAELAERTIVTLRDRFYGVDGILLQSIETADRPLPRGGWPCVGNLPHMKGVFVAVAHPGIVFAPLIGRITADAILDGKRDPSFANFKSL